MLRGAALYKIKLTEIYTHAGVELAPSDHRWACASSSRGGVHALPCTMAVEHYTLVL